MAKHVIFGADIEWIVNAIHFFCANVKVKRKSKVIFIGGALPLAN